MLSTVISIFYIDFGGFTNDPLYLGYNSTEQETPVLCIFNFQWPSWIQKDLGFFRSILLWKMRSWSTWTNVGGPEAHVGMGGVAHTPARASYPILALERPHPSVLISNSESWPKNYWKYVLEAIIKLLLLRYFYYCD
jgi:hypothetical protein